MRPASSHHQPFSRQCISHTSQVVVHQVSRLGHRRLSLRLHHQHCHVHSLLVLRHRIQAVRLLRSLVCCHRDSRRIHRRVSLRSCHQGDHLRCLPSIGQCIAGRSPPQASLVVSAINTLTTTRESLRESLASNRRQVSPAGNLHRYPRSIRHLCQLSNRPQVSPAESLHLYP